MYIPAEMINEDIYPGDDTHPGDELMAKYPSIDDYLKSKEGI